MSAYLVLWRPHDGGGLLRRLEMFVDGQRVAWLWRGKTVTVDISPGAQEVQAKMDWTTSPLLRVDVTDGQQVEVEAALPITAMWDMFRKPKSALVIRTVGTAALDI